MLFSYTFSCRFALSGRRRFPYPLRGLPSARGSNLAQYSHHFQQLSHSGLSDQVRTSGRRLRPWRARSPRVRATPAPPRQRSPGTRGAAAAAELHARGDRSGAGGSLRPAAPRLAPMLRYAIALERAAAHGCDRRAALPQAATAHTGRSLRSAVTPHRAPPARSRGGATGWGGGAPGFVRSLRSLPPPGRAVSLSPRYLVAAPRGNRGLPN